MLLYTASHLPGDQPLNKRKRIKQMNHKDILTQSLSIIEDRHQEYGDASSSFTKAATIAGTILGKNISAYDVSVVMMAVKLARIANQRTHQDSWIDLAAYTAFAGQFAETKLPDAAKATQLQVVLSDLDDQIATSVRNSMKK